MGLVLTTAPAAEPVSIDEAKAHLRVDITDDDTLITSLITAARERAEAILRRALITQTWDFYRDAFPGSSSLKLPFPPLQSVTHVKYTDKDGNESTFDASNYIVDVASEPGRIVLAYGKSWPSATLQPVNGLVVRFVCGYGDAGADVPQTMRQAVLLMIGEWYENRENATQPRQSEIPLSAKMLLWPDRIL